MIPEARPLTIGPKNAEAMIGHSWRWLRDHAEELGVRLVQIDGKRVVMADELLAALERFASPAAPPAEPLEAEDEIAAMRRRIARAG